MRVILTLHVFHNRLYMPFVRFSLNWVKLRAWELEEFDAVLLVDSDLTVLGDLSHIFTLPTAFAAVPDQDPVAPAWWFGSLGKIQGGMLFIRPCRAVAQHMISMLQHDRLLHFEYEYAEQVCGVGKPRCLPPYHVAPGLSRLVLQV